MTALLLAIVAPGYGLILFASLQSATFRDDARVRVEDAAHDAYMDLLR